MSAADHGSASTYDNHGCRCDECRAANAARHAAARKRRKVDLGAGRAVVPHGKASTYANWGCRCAACTAARRDAKRAYTAKRRAS